MLAVCLDSQHFFVWARVSTCEFGNLARYYLAPSATLLLSPLIGTAVAACLLRIVVILLVQPVCSAQHLELGAAVELVAKFLFLLVKGLYELLGEHVTLF